MVVTCNIFKFILLFINYRINRVELLGGVAADPEFLVSKKGDSFSTFRLFTNVDYRRRDGVFSEQVEVHDIHVFNIGLINYLKKNVKRGFYFLFIIIIFIFNNFLL